jgi:arginyl-tRNA synthetase
MDSFPSRSEQKYFREYKSLHNPLHKEVSDHLHQTASAAVVQMQKTKKEFEGHLTLVVFPFLKMSRKGPEQTAQEIGEYLKANEPAVAAFNVIKGFLNLTIASATWIELLNEIQADEQYGLVVW